ncbi:MAG: DUF2029 domain-containing protein [Candidatus Kerfeldbacteria bacterium]|nr:DUF2029 domain-containing protein [Candidatus Kerfeldbacteria bacterium]
MDVQKTISSEGSPADAWRGIGMIIFICGLAWFGYHTLYTTFVDRDVFSDFPTYYFSATALSQGVDFYDQSTIAQLGREIPYAKDMGAYLYPPVLLELLTPLTTLGYQPAKIIWALISLVALFFIGKELWRRIRPEQRDLFWGLSGFLLMSWPMKQVLVHGQLELIILFLILVAFRWSQHNHAARAGIALGIATTLKLYPAFFFLYFIYKKQWGSLCYGIATILVLIGISFAMLPGERLNTFTTSVMPKLLRGEASQQTVGGKISYAGTKYWPNNYSLSGLFAHTMTKQDVSQGLIDAPKAATALYYGSAIAVLLTTLYLLFVRRAQDSLLSLSLLSITFLLINPLVWEYYLVLAIPAFFWFFDSSTPPNKFARYAFIIMALAFAVICLDIYYWYPFMRQGVGTLIMSIKIIALLSIYGVLTWRSWSSSRDTLPTPTLNRG